MEPGQADQLLRKWTQRIKRYQLAHRLAAKGCRTYHLWVGIPAVSLSAVVGTSIFASLDAGAAGLFKISMGLLSVAAAILTALQTFLGFDENASKHQVADSGYGAIRQRSEYYLTFLHSMTADEVNQACTEVREELERLVKESPMVPERYWQKARLAMARVDAQGSLPVPDDIVAEAASSEWRGVLRVPTDHI